MYIADLLSRSVLNTPVKDKREMKKIVHSFEFDLPISKDSIHEIKAATNKNPALLLVKRCCQTEWPNKNAIAEPDIKSFYKIKDDIHIIV